MPLLGKIVVIKRNGTDGTEFPLTASCLFGRKLDCDIRIQLPQVSKEHCRIEFNENKELILTNLSSVNPTRINGEILQQSERLKHGDLITIIDRSFRFEYPPASTPMKKRLSTPAKGESVKVLQDQQLKSTPGTTEKKSEVTTGTCLKDGSNLPICQEQSATDHQDKASMDTTSSPFSDLYNMVKRDLATKPVWKSASLSNTPLSSTSLDKQEVVTVSTENVEPVTSKSSQKKRRTTGANPLDGSQTENQTPVKTATPEVQGGPKRPSEVIDSPVSQTPQQITSETPSTKSPKSRRGSMSQSAEKQTTPQNPPQSAEPKEKPVTRTSPRANQGKRFQVQDALQEVEATPTHHDPGTGQPSSKKHKCDDLPLPAAKKKRVSFGGQLSPELFDKRLPPNSPLRRGATPGRRSLGFTQKSHSLLRRASTIGLMSYQLEEDIAESPAKNASPNRLASPAKKAPRTPSPAKKAPRTPSPAKQSSGPRDKALSPKNSKSFTPPNQSTPKSSKRLSNASVKLSLSSEASLLETPTIHGRFSVSRISTPSPVSDEKDAKEDPKPAVKTPQDCATPRATPRRSSMKESARKTPRGLLKSAHCVVRSRRSGATRANLKVVSSWADIVKFGQTKPQTECGVKAANKKVAVKQTKVYKPTTPASRLKNHTSTGHADSPASIVVGKAHLRSTRLVGAAPKVVCNVAVLKRDLKMDEDLTGVSEIFKTPANSRRKSAFKKSSECLATPIGEGEMPEMSAINTPEESGEMVVSPISVTSTAKVRRYNMDAVTRFLQDNKDGSLIENMDESVSCSSSEPCTAMPSEACVTNEKAAPAQTPQHKPTPTECLTGVKRLMRTPRQTCNPVEDLRGKLLKTPKQPKLPQAECLEGIEELFNTPKQKRTPSKQELSGSNKLMTPTVKNSPVACAVASTSLAQTPKDIIEQREDLTGVKQLMKTPKQKKLTVNEDLTGVQQMMKTPKPKKQPVVEDLTGIKQMMTTPKPEKQPVVEDLTGVQQLMKTPKPKKQPVVEDLTGVQQLMKTPKPEKQPVVEDLTGIKQMMTTPKPEKQPVVEDLTGIKQMMTTPKPEKQPVEDLVGVKSLLQTPNEKVEPLEHDFGIDHLMKMPKQIIDEMVGSVAPVVLSVEAEDVGTSPEEAVAPQVETEEEVTSHEFITYVDKDVQKAPLEICTFDVISTTVETTPSAASLTQEEQPNRSSPTEKTKRGSQVRFAQTSQTSQEHHVASDSSSAEGSITIEESCAVSTEPVLSVRKSAAELCKTVVQSPARKSTRGRNLKELVEAPQSSLASIEDERLTLRRGRKAQREMINSQVGPVADLKASAEVEVSMKSPAPVRVKRGRKTKCDLEKPQEPEALVEEVEVASESAELQPSAEAEAPVKANTRARRGRPTKKEQIDEPVETKSPGASVEEFESTARNETSLESTTKRKRGRPTRKEILQNSQVKESSKPLPIGNSDLTMSPDSSTVKSTEVQSAVETEGTADVNLKPRRGRAMRKASPVTAQGERTSEPTSESTVLPEEKLEIPSVKAGRGRRVNPLTLRNQAVVDEGTKSQPKPEPLVVRSGRGARNKQLQPPVEVSVHVQDTETTKTAALTKELVEEPLVKNIIEGGQRTRKLKAPVLDDARGEEQDNPSTDSDSVQTLVAPAAKTTRGKRAFSVQIKPEAPVKRGRRAASVEVPPPVVKSSRGRKSTAKSEPEEKSTEVVGNSNKTNVLESENTEPPLTRADSEMEEKKGRRGKMSKATAKDISVGGVQEPQHNKDEPAADPTVNEIKQAAGPSSRGRKGRWAKKREEPETKDPDVEKNNQPVRRERAAPAVVTQSDVGTKRGQKRKGPEPAAEKTSDTEPLTKRTRRKGASAETQPDVAVSAKRLRTAAKEPEETSEVETEETSKKDEKLVRGRRKLTSAPALDPSPDVTTRRGTRGQKNPEADVPSAPVRRTRKK